MFTDNFTFISSFIPTCLLTGTYLLLTGTDLRPSFLHTYLALGGLSFEATPSLRNDTWYGHLPMLVPSPRAKARPNKFDDMCNRQVTMVTPALYERVAFVMYVLIQFAYRYCTVCIQAPSSLLKYDPLMLSIFEYRRYNVHAP